ncbi:MAG: carboxypeptidase regulatory-like domain-containing protein, partial [Thermoplasmata archaeon]|nr:carboxypeptidase regulatory-like domain-containing protein [Thermoplasmata archaeon]
TWESELYSSPYEVEINLTPPEVEITDPVDGAYVNDLNLTISWKMYDEGAGLDHVEMALNDGEWVDVGLRYQYGLYHLISASSIDPLEGQYSISVRVYDHLGLHSTDTIYLFLDGTDPVVSIISPEAGTYLKGSSFLVEWSSGSDLSGISHYLVKMDDEKELLVEGNKIMYYDLEDGRHMISVTALDNAGNHKTLHSHFYVDNTAPHLTMRTEFPGNYSASRNILLEWDSHDDLSGLDRLLLKVDSNLWIKPDGEGYHAVTNLEEGLHLINILAYDNVGNSNDLLLSIMVDLNDPYVTIHFPSDGEMVTQSDDLKFGWVGMDPGSGISGYEVSLDGEPDVATSLTHRSYGELSQGNHTLRVVAIDGVGRREEVTVKFSIDSIRPTAAILTSVGPGDQPPGCIEVVFSEDMKRETVKVWINGDPGIVNWLNGNWLKVWPRKDLELGTMYLVQISGGDLSGNYLLETSFMFSTPDLGILRGKVVDSNGHPIPNCLIHIDEITIISDLNGDFNLSLPSGAYTVLFTKEGFEDRAMEVDIRMGEESNLPSIDLVLEKEGNILNWKGYLNLLIALTLALIMVSSIFIFIYYRRPRAIEKEPPEMKEVMDSVRRFRSGRSNIGGGPRGTRRTTVQRDRPPLRENNVCEKLGMTSEDLDEEIMNAYTQLNSR